MIETLNTIAAACWVVSGIIVLFIGTLGTYLAATHFTRKKQAQ